MGMERSIKLLVSRGKKPSALVVQGGLLRFRKKGLNFFYPSGSLSPSLSRWILKNMAHGYYQS